MENSQGAIELVINDEVRKLQSEKKLVEFVEFERSAWSWLQEGSAKNFMKELYAYLYSKPLQSLSREMTSANLARVTLGGKDWRYIASDSLDGKLVGQVRSEHGDVVAGFALYFLANDKRNTINYNNGHIGRAFQEVVHLRDRELAAFIVFSNSGLSGVGVRAGNDTVAHLVKKLHEATDEALDNIGHEQSRIKDNIQQFEADKEQSFRKQTRRFSKRSKVYKRLGAITQEMAQECLVKAKKDLEAATAAYRDQVDLEASVTYWNSRRDDHKAAKKNWLIVTVLSMVITLASLFGYYALGGVTGATKYLDFYGQYAQGVDVDKGEKNSSGGGKADADNNHSVLGRVIVDMAGAALLMALFSALIRVGLKEFNINSHLEIDSAEKVTLTKTYLALLNEGKLKSDDDRRLVLEGLFRASNPSVAAAEAAFSSPVEMIVKTMSERAGKIY